MLTLLLVSEVCHYMVITVNNQNLIQLCYSKALENFAISSAQLPFSVMQISFLPALTLPNGKEIYIIMYQT